MKAEKHISELLYEHDCVIIPGFGGLVCNYSPARIDRKKNLFIPPFKKTSFNRNLINNDGLLAARISQQENISYAEAVKMISEFAGKLNEKLERENRAEIPKVGIFYKGKENTLLFEQNETMNYLPEAIGMKPFFSPPVKRESLERKVERKLQDKKIIPSKGKTEAAARRRVPVLRYASLAALLALASSLVFISLKTEFLNNTGFANLNPFAEKAEQLYHPSEIILPEIEKVKIEIPETKEKFISLMPDGKTPVMVRMEEAEAVPNIKPQIQNLKTQIKSQKGKKTYHIIGGAFAVPENAEKFSRKLQKQGYSPVILEKNLRLVSYGGYATREEALAALDKIRALQPEAWLMR